MAQFEVIKDTKGEYRWRFRANNYEIIADSGEGYKSKDDCEHAINLVKKQAPDAPVVDRT